MNGVTKNTEALLRIAREYRVITGASLNRIFNHIEDGESYAFLSAFRPELSAKENKKRQQDLQSQIRGLGYGFIKLKGQWEDTENVDEEGNSIIYKEDSAFIIGIPLDQALGLVKKFSQDAVLWGTKNNDAALYDSQGSKFLDLNTPTLQGIEKLFSSFKNYKFKFGRLEYIPHGYTSGLIWLKELKEHLTAKLSAEQVASELLVNRVISRF